MKQIVGILFGEQIFVESENEQAVKQIVRYMSGLDARETRIRNKEIELDLAQYENPN